MRRTFYFYLRHSRFQPKMPFSRHVLVVGAVGPVTIKFREQKMQSV
jgi:hypothetical protein